MTMPILMAGGMLVNVYKQWIPGLYVKKYSHQRSARFASRAPFGFKKLQKLTACACDAM